MSYSPHAFGITKGESAASKFYLANTNGDIEFQDSDKVIFGNGADVSIFWDDGNSVFKIGTDNSGKAITIGHATSEVTVADNLTVTGNLTVSGTTTTVDSTTVNLQNGFVFEGATDDAHATTMTMIDPTADRTIYLPNVGGYIPVLAVESATAISATPEELNILDGVTSTAAELNILDGVTSTAAELNILDGVTATANEINKIAGGTSRVSCTIVDADGILVNDGGSMKMVLASELKTYASGGGATAADDITTGDAAVTITTSVGNITIDAAADNTDIIFKGTDDTVDITMLTLDGSEDGAATFKSTVTATGFTIGATAITATAAELNILDGVTSTAAELNLLDGVTSTTDELNILDGVTSTAAELNLLDGSSAGTAVASKAVVLDASKNIATIGTIGCGAITSTGSSSFGATSFGDNDITNVGNIALDSITADGSTITITGNTTFADGAYDFDIASHDTSNGLKLGGALVTATAAELNILDGVTSTAAELNLLDGSSAGTVANSKAVIYSSAGIVQATDLKVPDDGGIHGGTVSDFIVIGSDTVTIKDGAYDFDIASHDTSNGLKLGGALVTATAAELNILDGVTSTAAELNILDGVTASASQINSTVTTVTSAAAISATSNRYLLVDTDGGAVTVTLNGDVTNGTIVTIKKKTSDTAAVTITSTDNIDGGTGDLKLNYQNEAMTFISDGGDWYVV